MLAADCDFAHNMQRVSQPFRDLSAFRVLLLAKQSAYPTNYLGPGSLLGVNAGLLTHSGKDDDV
jgi:hypothetical protein